MLSAVVSVLSGVDYMRKFFSAAWRPSTTP